jgi:hypothetical protein
MAPSRVDKSLRILTTHQHSTYSLPLASQGKTNDARHAHAHTARHGTHGFSRGARFIGREDAEEASGATATIALLSRALRSQFCAELFREVRPTFHIPFSAFHIPHSVACSLTFTDRDQLSEGVSEATRQGHKSEWWWSNHAHVFENEITFYDATIRARPLSIRLASSRTAPPVPSPSLCVRVRSCVCGRACRACRVVSCRVVCHECEEC